MTTTPSVPTAYDAWKAAAAPQPTLLRLLVKALEEASQLEAADAYLEAAANALILAWAKQACIGPWTTWTSRTPRERWQRWTFSFPAAIPRR